MEECRHQLVIKSKTEKLQKVLKLPMDLKAMTMAKQDACMKSKISLKFGKFGFFFFYEKYVMYVEVIFFRLKFCQILPKKKTLIEKIRTNQKIRHQVTTPVTSYK